MMRGALEKLTGTERMQKLLKTVFVCLCSALPMTAHAQSVQDDIIADLVADGYTQISVSRTLLGRLRFVAVGQDGTREVVVQPSNGAILRDHRDDDDDDRVRTSGGDDRSGTSASSGSGSSGSSGESDDDDDAKDDDRDDDRGGKDDDKDDRDDDKDDDRGDDRDRDRGRDR